VLLREVAEAKPVPGYDASLVRIFSVGEEPQQRGLARAVEPQDDEPAAPVDGHVDPRQHLVIAVGLGQADSAQRHPAARRRLGQPDPRHLVPLTDRLQVGQQPVGPSRHVLRRHGGGRSRTHLVRLQVQGGRLPLGVGPLPGTAPLVGLALLQVRRPAGVVHVDRGPLRIDVEHPVGDVGHQVHVVADQHQPARVRPEETAQPGDRVGVEVVRRLVQQQGVMAGEQDPRQLDAAPLSAGQVADRLLHRPIRQAETRGNPRGFGFGGVATAGLEFGVGPGVGSHRPGQVRRIGCRSHGLLGRAESAEGAIQIAGRQNAIRHGHRRIRRGRVLREVADRTDAADGAARRLELAGQRPQQGGLAGAVAADQADPVAGSDGERDVGKQKMGADADVDTANGDHGVTLRSS